MKISLLIIVSVLFLGGLAAVLGTIASFPNTSAYAYSPPDDSFEFEVMERPDEDGLLGLQVTRGTCTPNHSQVINISVTGASGDVIVDIIASDGQVVGRLFYYSLVSGSVDGEWHIIQGFEPDTYTVIAWDDLSSSKDTFTFPFTPSCFDEYSDFHPSVDVECPAGYEFNGTTCAFVCSDDAFYKDGVCTVVDSKPDGPICGEGTMLENGECIPKCGNGTTFENGMCVIESSADRSSKTHGDCLIATASFGSELAPQVQMLREIRDNVLLDTELGKIFMSGFNTIYYSFSPEIADLENKNPAFKEAVKTFITPMITTLSIMTLAEEGSESHVILYGLAAIGLIVGMYVVAPATLIWKLRNRK